MTESYEQYAKDLTSRVEYYNIGYAGKSYQRKLRDAFFGQERIDWVLKKDVRLNDKSANPTSYRKMDVSCAMIPFEHKTLQFAEEIICNVLGITAEEIKREVSKRLRQKNPQLRLGHKLGTHPNRFHGYHLEKAKYIVEKIMEVESSEGGSTPLSDTHNAILSQYQTQQVEDTGSTSRDIVGDDIAKDDDDFDGDDDEMAALNLEGIIEENRQTQANAEQMILDEIHEPLTSTTASEAPPHPTMPHYCKVSGETHCEASTSCTCRVSMQYSMI